MQIKLNGKETVLEPKTSLEELILSLKLQPSVVVAELNENIIKQEQWSAVQFREGDSLELVSFVGGG